MKGLGKRKIINDTVHWIDPGLIYFFSKIGASVPGQTGFFSWKCASVPGLISLLFRISASVPGLISLFFRNEAFALRLTSYIFANGVLWPGLTGFTLRFLSLFRGTIQWEKEKKHLFKNNSVNQKEVRGNYYLLNITLVGYLPTVISFISEISPWAL